MSYTPDHIRDVLAEKRFGILTEIDVNETMKKKLYTDIEPYRIFGASNPEMVYKAIGLQPRIGAMLPCHVILRKVDEGTEISAIDPVALMQAIKND